MKIKLTNNLKDLPVIKKLNVGNNIPLSGAHILCVTLVKQLEKK